MLAPRNLDRDRCEQLAEEILKPVRAHYAAEPISPDRVWEVLNALAFAAASVIVGTGTRPARRATRTFLDEAITDNVAHLLRDPPSGAAH